MKTISLVIREADYLNKLKELLDSNDFDILTAKRSLFESAFDIIVKKPAVIIISHSIVINSIPFLKAVTKLTHAKLLIFNGGSPLLEYKELKSIEAKHLSNTFTEKELLSTIDSCLASDNVMKLQ